VSSAATIKFEAFMASPSIEFARGRSLDRQRPQDLDRREFSELAL
jgi:hypothetical protein